MSLEESLGEIKVLPSENKWRRAPLRRKSRNNPQKKSSLDYVKKPKAMRLSKKSGSEYRYSLCPSGYTRGQAWGALFRAWMGFRISNDPRKGETIFDRMSWAQKIQDIETDLSLPRSSFPQLGILGDVVFMFDKMKELDLQDLHDEEKEKQWKKERKFYARQIVQASHLSYQEQQWLRDDFAGAVISGQNGYVEKISMINAFDMVRGINTGARKN